MEKDTNSAAISVYDSYSVSAERADAAQIRALHTLIESTPHIQSILNAMPFVVLILNTNRQIVAANEKVISLLGVSIDDALGKRPGELIGCINADRGPSGCGTGIYCKVCGAVNAMVKCIESGNKVTEECQISLQKSQSLDWEVTSSPLEIEGHPLFCLAAQDISDQNRRSSLERTFFHDVINQIGAISGFVKLMAEDYPESEEFKEIFTLTNELLEEVFSQRNLTLAENGDLLPKPEPVELSSLLQRLGQLYQRHPVAGRKQVCVLAQDAPAIQTDPQLLKRVVGNMLKNALEASPPNQTVTLSCEQQERYVSIHVHNTGLIPQDIGMQIFKRSFSTKKDPGHGIGTYSMKLLGEKYLKGCVWFTSTPEAGTTFTISLPLNLEQQPAG